MPRPPAFISEHRSRLSSPALPADPSFELSRALFDPEQGFNASIARHAIKSGGNSMNAASVRGAAQLAVARDHIFRLRRIQAEGRLSCSGANYL